MEKEGAAVEDKIKVVVVDDQKLARMYVDLFVKSSTRYELIGSLAYAEDALPFCRIHAPQLVIMDIVFGRGMNGLSAAIQLKQELPALKIILATSMAEPQWMTPAKAAGIDSFWYKEYSRLPLLEIMDRTMAGERVYVDEPPQAILGRFPTSELSEQQRRMLALLTMGLPNKEIAEKLHLSPLTVKAYLEKLMDRTGLHSRTELAVAASQLGLAGWEDGG